MVWQGGERICLERCPCPGNVIQLECEDPL